MRIEHILTEHGVRLNYLITFNQRSLPLSLFFSASNWEAIEKQRLEELVKKAFLIKAYSISSPVRLSTDTEQNRPWFLPWAERSGRAHAQTAPPGRAPAPQEQQLS